MYSIKLKHIRAVDKYSDVLKSVKDFLNIYNIEKIDRREKKKTPMYFQIDHSGGFRKGSFQTSDK